MVVSVKIFYPAVTKVLNKTQPIESQLALAAWRARVGEEEADRICSESRDRGIVIHDCIASFLHGETPSPSIYLSFWQNIEKVIGKVQRVQQVEEPLVNHSLRYQGRLDLLAYWENKLTIFDFKTSEKPKQKSWMIDAFLQIAAYMGAIEASTDYVVEQGLIVVGTEEESQLFLIDKKELTLYWQQWLERLNQYQKQKKK